MENESEIKTINPADAPKDPWAALAWWLQEYHITRSGEDKNSLQEAEDFFSSGRAVSLPQLITINDEKIPYQLYPTASYRVINACVKVLEKQLEEQMQIAEPTLAIEHHINAILEANKTKTPTPELTQNLVSALRKLGPSFEKEFSSIEKTNLKMLEVFKKEIGKERLLPEKENRIIDGIMTLADSLFSGACTHPDGQFSIHRVDRVKREIVLNPHGRRIKQLATRLESYRNARITLATYHNDPIDLPTLSCQQIIKHEIRASQQLWRIVDLDNYEGQTPFQLKDSLDSLKENLGYEATQTENNENHRLDFEDEKEEAFLGEFDQPSWTGLPVIKTRFLETSRGNVTATLKDSLWNYEEDPLSFITDYICTHTKPLLEEASSLLIQALNNPYHRELGGQALVIDAKKKKNPDSYWKIIQSITKNFPGRRQEESEAMLHKLNCARFNLCLDSTNRKFGINPEEYTMAFQEKVYRTVNNPKNKNVTRNEILMDLFLETPEAKKNSWTKKDAEIWLETLQSQAVGGYENSEALDNIRNQILASLNHTFHQPRIKIEAAKNNPVELEEAFKQIDGTLQSCSNNIFKYLTGVSGQVLRREMRHKITEMKNSATERLGAESHEVQALKAVWSFVDSISSQVKSGDWYNKEEENKSIIYHFLKLMLQSPKTHEVEFQKSSKPGNADPLPITIDFLKTYANEHVPSGKQTIEEVITAWKEIQESDEGGQLSAALSKITKNKVEGIEEIKERKLSLEGAISITKGIYQSNNIYYLRDAIKTEQDILEIFEEEQTLPNSFTKREGEPNPPTYEKTTEEINKGIAWLQFQSKTLRELSDKKPLTPLELRDAIKASKAGITILEGVLSTPKPENLNLEEKLLSEITSLKEIITNRFEENYKFWKGLTNINCNILSRNEAGANSTGIGTILNYIAASKAKLQNRDISKNKTGAILKQFRFTDTRERTLASNVHLPIATWLLRKEKGITTKITQEEFLEQMEFRHKACILCLEISNRHGGINEKLKEFQERELENKISANAHIINNCILMLDSQEDFRDGIEWQNKNEKRNIQLQNENPELDTPNQKIKFLKSTRENKKQKTKEIKLEEITGEP